MSLHEPQQNTTFSFPVMAVQLHVASIVVPQEPTTHQNPDFDYFRISRSVRNNYLSTASLYPPEKAVNHKSFAFVYATLRAILNRVTNQEDASLTIGRPHSPQRTKTPISSEDILHRRTRHWRASFTQGASDMLAKRCRRILPNRSRTFWLAHWQHQRIEPRT